MEVIVKYFGIFQECAGIKEKRMEVPDRTAVHDLYEIVSKFFPKKRRLPKILFAVNQEFAKPNQQLKDGDELALIPPMSGG